MQQYVHKIEHGWTMRDKRVALACSTTRQINCTAGQFLLYWRGGLDGYTAQLVGGQALVRGITGSRDLDKQMYSPCQCISRLLR
jgi:hypothetical protein